MSTIKVGDRFIYTTPSGREVIETVVEVDVKPRYPHKPGLCVRLRSEHGGLESTMWPEDIWGHPEWWRPVPQ